MKNEFESSKDRTDRTDLQSLTEQEEAMRQVLDDFRMSVHAWSDATWHQPRRISAAEHKIWRRATAWALGCVLAAGALITGVYPLRHKAAPTQTAQQTTMQQPIHEAPPAARPQTSAPTEEVQVAQEDESWMTKVDTDVSRQVPAAMEPLALLAAEDEQQ